jgi:hypothetical protein
MSSALAGAGVSWTAVVAAAGAGRSWAAAVAAANSSTAKLVVTFSMRGFNMTVSRKIRIAIRWRSAFPFKTEFFSKNSPALQVHRAIWALLRLKSELSPDTSALDELAQYGDGNPFDALLRVSAPAELDIAANLCA